MQVMLKEKSRPHFLYVSTLILSEQKAPPNYFVFDIPYRAKQGTTPILLVIE